VALSANGGTALIGGPFAGGFVGAAWVFADAPALIAPLPSSVAGTTPANTVLGAALAKLTALRESYSVFTVARRSTPLTGRTAASHHHRGTVFSFRLDRQATVVIAIKTRSRGRRLRGRCVSERRAPQHARRCLRTVTVATLRLIGHDRRLNKVPFSARIAGRALRPGRYSATFTAIDEAGASPGQTLRFMIKSQ
jgi:hypothetical protein